MDSDVTTVLGSGHEAIVLATTRRIRTPWLCRPLFYRFEEGFDQVPGFIQWLPGFIQ